MNRNRYTCVKCQNRNYDSGEMRVAGGFWSKIFNVQGRKFITISCQKCGHTEFYNQKGATTAENILDLFTG